ncbi:MAG: hypothetical protein ABI194_04525 [Gemmatimonadaceae bacterium]
MSDRVRFIPNPRDSTRVLLIDLSGFGAPLDSLPHISAARDEVASQPPKSLCCVVDVTGSRFNIEVVEAVKDLAAHNIPYVIASAVVGVSGLQRVIMEGVLKFTGRSNLKAVATRDEAFAWLAEQTTAHVPN